MAETMAGVIERLMRQYNESQEENERLRERLRVTAQSLRDGFALPSDGPRDAEEFATAAISEHAHLVEMMANLHAELAKAGAQLSRETRRRIAAEQAWQRWIDGHQIEGDYFVNGPEGDASDVER